MQAAGTGPKKFSRSGKSTGSLTKSSFSLEEGDSGDVEIKTEQEALLASEAFFHPRAGITIVDL